MSNHPIVHVEIPAASRLEASDFYHKVFGWEATQHPEMNYATFRAEGGPGGGFSPTAGEQAAEVGRVMVFIGTDDIESSLASIQANGGSTVLPKTEIPGVGWFAIFRDPTGNQLALYTDGGMR